MPITQDRLAELILAGEAWAGALRAMGQGLEAGTAAVSAGVMTADDLLAVLSANLAAEQAKLVEASATLAREREWLRCNSKRNDQERARKRRRREERPVSDTGVLATPEMELAIDEVIGAGAVLAMAPGPLVPSITKI